MAFQSAKSVGEQELIRVDYEKYLLGEERFILKEDKIPASIGGELRQVSLGGSPISFQDKASGGLQRCADVSCHAKHVAHLAASTPRRT